MIRVLIVDDNEAIRESLRALLRRDDTISVVAMAVDGASAIAQLTEHAPDVVVLDISLPDRTGVDVASQMSREKPHVAIIALSAYSEEPYVRAMLEAGARGYVLKVRAVDELVRAIHHVAGGHIYLGSQLDVHAGADAPR